MRGSLRHRPSRLESELIDSRNYAKDQASLVLGIVGLLLCPVLCPFVIAYSRPGSAGRALGIAGTAFWGLTILAIVLLVRAFAG
jgi:hypothetical protein